MILGLIVTIYGLVMLIRGKGFGKDAVAHPQYRLLGGFLATFLPVQLVVGLILGVVIAATNSTLSQDELERKLTVPAIVLGLGFLVTYLLVAHFWEKAIKRKATRPNA